MEGHITTEEYARTCKMQDDRLDRMETTMDGRFNSLEKSIGDLRKEIRCTRDKMIGKGMAAIITVLSSGLVACVTIILTQALR